MITQDTKLLAAALPISVYMTYIFGKRSGKATGTFLNSLENATTIPALFGIVVLFQGLFGGLGFKAPQKVIDFLERPAVSTFAMFLVAFSGTSDIELSFFIILTFLITMQFLRTPEERKEHPYLI